MGATGWVCAINRIIPTIRKHIVSEQALAGGNEYVGIEEPAPFGVIIPALEIIEPGFWDRLVATRAILNPAPSGGFPPPGQIHNDSQRNLNVVNQ